ncbi:MAG: glycosyltransferase [Sediminibacterium sp.]|nr:glycosyltransferase [Sediminibacterium sp.]
MKVSVIIVNYNVKYFLEVCLHSVYRALTGTNGEVIVVDNNSTDDSCEMVRRQFPETILIANQENTGFSKANNQGVAIARGEYILFLNPDTVMPEDFFQRTIPYLDGHPQVGALGPRLIDGKGTFAPDSKKSFPTLSVAIFKTTGINKIFSQSPYFNKYYAVHIKEQQTAEVEVLSGCCMLVRRKAIDEAGGAFDEDYFMYCEDVDLSYRLQKSGYPNIYFPEATLIHYKGESTRKATLSYVRIFNEALSTFVRKHYDSQKARLFILFINIGIVLRAILSAVKNVLKVLRMPLFDALVLLGSLSLMQNFWVEHVKNIGVIPPRSLYLTFPVYVVLWLVSMFFNGAYDQPYRPLRVARGMVTGTIAILAYYGLLPPDLRYSRALIVFSGVTGTVALLGLHELLYRLGILKFIPYDKLPRKAVIVGTESDFEETSATLRRVNYAPELSGRVSISAGDTRALATLAEMKSLLYTAGINEVIFCVKDLSYEEVFRQMQLCGKEYDYKIHLPNSQSFIGSNSSNTAGDLYTIDRKYNLSSFSQLRNKRMLDILSALVFLLLFPLALLAKRPGGFLANCVRVLSGRKTWVGYSGNTRGKRLPVIKPGVVPPFNILPGYTPGEEVKQQLDTVYAQHYWPGADIGLILKNYKYLGGS